MRVVLACSVGVVALAAMVLPHPPQDAAGGVIRVTLCTLGPIHWAYPDLASVRLIASDGSTLSPELDLEHRRDVVFTVPGAGPYTLDIDDPRFTRVEMKDLVPSESRVEAFLWGRSALRLRVFEGSDGNEITSWTASLRLENSSYPSTEEPWDKATIWSKPNPLGPHARTDCFELPGGDAPQDPSGWFVGIAPGDYTLIVSAEGHATSYVACPGLAADEGRELEVPMWAPSSVTGAVEGVPPFDSKSGFPIEVFAYVPGEEVAPPPGMTFGVPVVPEDYRGFRLTRANCELGADGTFQLEGLAPGVYLIQARQRGIHREKPDAPFEVVASRASAVTLKPGESANIAVRWKPQ